jgi:hypothetical protein
MGAECVLRVLQATKFRGLVFVATEEFYGAEHDRLPAIFWAIVQPSAKLCSPSLLSWGMVASEQGLSLALPVITGRHECGAFLAFSYGGNRTIELNGEPYSAYAGKIPPLLINTNHGLSASQTAAVTLLCERLTADLQRGF